MVFKCNTCHREFERQDNLHRHQKLGACKVISVHCKFCGAGFSSKQSMYRHIRIVCKEKDKPIDVKVNNDVITNNNYTKYSRTTSCTKDIDDQSIEQFKFTQITDMSKIYDILLQLQKANEKLTEENKDLREITKELKVQLTNIITRSNINTHYNVSGDNNVNNGTINNIYLVGYGKEDMDRIDRSDLLKAVKTGFNSPLSLTETMHFNPKYPEFHNVYIPSMKDKYAMIYDGSEWTMVTKEYLIDKMYDDKRDYIEENLEEFLDSLTKSQQNALNRWMKSEETHPYISKIKDDIKLLMYNKRKIVTDTKKTCNSNIEQLIDLDMEELIPTTYTICEDIRTNIDIDKKVHITQKKVKNTRKSVFNVIAPRKGTKRKTI